MKSIRINKNSDNDNLERRVKPVKKVIDRNFGDTKSANILDMVGITKTFLGGKVIANNDIDLSIKRNEIHALIGENGSGKSTLMSILFGIYEPTVGEIFYNDEEIKIKTPMIAKQLGIGMVHQHYQLVENMTVIENVLLGQEGGNILPIKSNRFVKLSKHTRTQESNKLSKTKELSKPSKITKDSTIKDLIDTVKYSLSDGKDMQTIIAESKINITTLELDSKKTIALKNKIIKIIEKNEYKKSKAKFNELVKKYKFNLNADTKVHELTVGQKQKLEIIKVLWQDKDLIIFDEPTAALSLQEIQEFMTIIKSFKKEGKTVIFISHKLNEVKELADRLTILRKGHAIETVNNKNLNTDVISKKMIGELVKLEFKTKTQPTNEVVLELKNVSTEEKEKEQKLSNINLTVHKGEILGIAGVGDNGQTELLEAITGLRKIIGGNIEVNHVDVAKKTIFGRNQEIAHIPEDRHKYGLIPDMNLYDNSIVNKIDLEQFSKVHIDQSVPKLIENTREFKKYYWNTMKSALKIINLKMFSELKEIKKIKKEEKENYLYQVKKIEEKFGKEKEKVISHYINEIDSLRTRVRRYKEIRSEKIKTSLKDEENKFNRKNLMKELTDIREQLELIDYKPNRGINVIKNKTEIQEWTLDIIHTMDVHGAEEPRQISRNLSGGNQQKFVVGRELLQERPVLIAGHPTRGLDVKAIKNIYTHIIEGSKNTATLLCSYELEELMAVCDRIAVIHNGKIQGIVNAKASDALSKIGKAMVGGAI